jgi:hypothetical protein
MLMVCVYIVGCATTHQISYQQDVRPIFVDKCITCHTPPDGEGYKKSGLDMESHETLMEGSIYGPAIVPSNPRNSPVMILIEGRAGDLTRTLNKMHKPLSDHEIEVLSLWIEQGAQNN